MSFTFFFKVNCDHFFNTYIFPNNFISLIIPKLIRNLTSSQLKILYIYGFFSVFLYIYMHKLLHLWLLSFFFSFSFVFKFNFLEIETLLIVLIIFFLSPLLILSLYLSFCLQQNALLKNTITSMFPFFEVLNTQGKICSNTRKH